MTTTRILLTLCLTLGAGAPLLAQGTPRQQRLERQRIRQERRQAGAGVGSAQQPGAARNRPQLEQQLRRRLYQVVQQRVGLDDGQMQRLQRVNQQFEPRRRSLNQQERALRQSLRAEMVSSTPDQAKIDAQWKQLRDLQRQRLDILDQEDGQLAQFMTPLQRARYHAVQEQVRRRVEQMAQQRAAASALTPDDSAPPPPR